jgi:lipopolysaccharide biosynthesis protein
MFYRHVQRRRVMSSDRLRHSLIGDAAVQSRQLLRDLGPTPAAARQFVKMALRVASNAKPGDRIEGIRRKVECDYSMAVPFKFMSDALPATDIRVAAACHMFHPDLSAEFRSILTEIPGALDVLISTDTVPKRDEIVSNFNGWNKGSVDVRIVPNRGRDIGPKVTAYCDMYERYDVILYLHSKRNNHLVDGSEWRRYLLHTLAGSQAIAGSILEAFRRDPHLGIVMPQHTQSIRERLDWGDNFINARDLARRMGIKLTPAHVIEFPSGSMFWARPAALRPILDLGLQIEDFPEEAGQLDGTIAHAVERLFLFACEAAGYRWAKVCDPAGATHPRTIIPIDTSATLDAYNRRHGFRLTALGLP